MHPTERVTIAGKNFSETTNSLTKRLEPLRDEIKKLGFDIYKDDKIGNFTFIEARKIETSD